MEKRIMHIYFGNDLLPYKDKECQVHFPVAGNTFAGGSLATEIRFYVDNIGGYENITWLVNSKRPDGSLAYQKLTVVEEDGEKFLSLVLSSYYTQYVGDLYLTLNGYDGGVEIELDDTDPENPIWTISGTPIVQATGSIKLSIAYAVQMPSDYGEVPVISVQEALGIVNQKADKTYVDNQDQAIYSYVYAEVERLETAIDGKVDKKTTTGLYAYTHNGSTDGEIIVSQDAMPTSIPRYDNGARLKVNGPQLPIHVANKGYVDTQLATKQDKLVLGTGLAFINGQLTCTITGFSIDIVSSLPAVGSNGVLYLLEIESEEETNHYEEYLWIESENRYELIGSFSTDIDLSNYYTKSESDTRYGRLASNNTWSGNNNTFIERVITVDCFKVSDDSQYIDDDTTEYCGGYIHYENHVGADMNFMFPTSKANGNYTIATTDDITTAVSNVLTYNEALAILTGGN